MTNSSVQPDSYALDTTTTLQPSHLLYIHKPKTISQVVVINDVTSDILNRYQESDSLPCTAADEIKSITSNTKPTFTLSKSSPISLTWHYYDADQNKLADVTGGLVSFGVRNMTFPTDSPHSSHNIEMKPVGAMRRAETFTMNSVPYFWEIDQSEHKNRVLMKVIGEGKKREIGRLYVNKASQYGGILAIDGNQLDHVIGLLTCLTLLNQTDSFSR